MSGIAETFDFTPHPMTLCAQIGRAWADRLEARLAGAAHAADRLTFVEASGTAKGNIYAGTMPPRDLRATGPGVSISPTTAPANGEGRITPIGIEVRVRAHSLARCYAVLMSMRTWMLERERTLILPRSAASLYGQRVGAVPGVPASLTTAPACGEVEDLWAIVRVEPLTNLLPISAGGAAGEAGGTDEGEAEASMSMILHAYPVRVRGALEAFLALYDPSPGLVEEGRGTITVNASGTPPQIILTSNNPTGTTTITLTGKTVGEVRAEIAAVAGWSTEDGDDVLDAADATALVGMTATAAYSSGGGPVSIGRQRTAEDMDGNLG